MKLLYQLLAFKYDLIVNAPDWFTDGPVCNAYIESTYPLLTNLGPFVCLDYDASTPDKLVFDTYSQRTDEHSIVCETILQTVTVTPSFIHGICVDVHCDGSDCDNADLNNAVAVRFFEMLTSPFPVSGDTGN